MNDGSFEEAEPLPLQHPKRSRHNWRFFITGAIIMFVTGSALMFCWDKADITSALLVAGMAFGTWMVAQDSGHYR